MSSSSSSCTEEAITEIPEIIVDPVDEREVRALVAPNINYRSDRISIPSIVNYQHIAVLYFSATWINIDIQISISERSSGWATY